MNYFKDYKSIYNIKYGILENVDNIFTSNGNELKKVTFSLLNSIPEMLL